MSKVSILAALNKQRTKMVNQKNKLDTDITNAQTLIDESKSARQVLKAEIDQITLDIADVTASSLP